MRLVEAIRIVLQQKDLSTSQKMVLVALWRHADDHGVCWPSAATLAEETSLTERWVRQTIASLHAKGWIEVENQPGRTTRFTLRLSPELVSSKSGDRRTPELSSPRNSVHPGSEFTPEVSSGDPGTEFTPPRKSVQGTPELSSPEVSQEDTHRTTQEDAHSSAPREGADSPEPPATPDPRGGGRHRKRSSQEADPRVAPVIRRFNELHLAKLHKPYPVVGGRDGAAIRRLPKEYTTEDLLRLVELFFADPDPFVWERAGPSIPLFCQRIGALLAQERRSSGGAPSGRARDSPFVPDQLLPEEYRGRKITWDQYRTLQLPLLGVDEIEVDLP